MSPNSVSLLAYSVNYVPTKCFLITSNWPANMAVRGIAAAKIKKKKNYN